MTGALRIAAVNAPARRCGIRPGQALAEARAMLPALAVADHDPAADARLLETLADWADRYTPLVGRTPPDGLLLDLTGASHLLGGEAALQADVAARLAAQGFAVETAIAPTPGAAWGLARFGDARFGIGGMIVDNDGLRDALLPLPVAALRLAPETVAGLDRVGLKTIGDLAERPRAPLAARFGAHLLYRLDQALGHDDEAINPRQPLPPAIVEARFEVPLVREEDVAAIAADLMAQLCRLLESRGQGARALELIVFRVDGAVRRITVGAAAPSRDVKTLAGLLALKLRHLGDPLDAGFGFDLVRLAATEVAPCTATALTLPALDAAHETGMSAPELAQRVTRLADRLAVRFGGPQVLRPVLADHHRPETAATLQPAAQRLADLTTAAEPSGIGFSVGPHRPLRLFSPPEPVEIMAEVPDGPPLRLRWRRQSLRIVAAEGPERIVLPWWQGGLDAAGRAPRDYYRVADETGRRLWIFREGLYPSPRPGALRPPQPAPQPRWFVHGIFA